MCGRYGLISNERKIEKEFDAERTDFDLRENYNASPTQKMPVVERHSPNSLHLREWGFRPEWNPKLFILNARDDKLTGRLWIKSLREDRCIVPADYFFEWKKLSATGKQPYLFRLKNKKMMGFAGLLHKSINKYGKDEIYYVIITTSPNKTMEDVHNRMPAILSKEDQDFWLNPENVDPEQLLALLKPYPDDELEKFPVSKSASNSRNNSPEVIEKIKLEEKPKAPEPTQVKLI